MLRVLRNLLLQPLRELKPLEIGDDESIFADDGLTITPLRLTVNGSAYDVGEIQSVKSVSNEGAFTVLIIFGSMMSFFSIGMIYATDGTGAAIFMIPTVLGAVVAGSSVYLWAKMTYPSFASGGKLTLRSKR
jgi:hypothetical protein